MLKLPERSPGRVPSSNRPHEPVSGKHWFHLWSQRTPKLRGRAGLDWKGPPQACRLSQSWALPSGGLATAEAWTPVLSAGPRQPPCRPGVGVGPLPEAGPGPPGSGVGPAHVLCSRGFAGELISPQGGDRDGFRDSCALEPRGEERSVGAATGPPVTVPPPLRTLCPGPVPRQGLAPRGSVPAPGYPQQPPGLTALLHPTVLGAQGHTHAWCVLATPASPLPTPTKREQLHVTGLIHSLKEF